ncbi:50S ribosomal protein L13 [Patescibacteria group bacterium]|nr:50S ribosomal protein L13 [Patescibacteria group bacterium]
MHTIDAKGKILGRVATEVVSVLLGKNKVSARNNLVAVDEVTVVNTDFVKLSGSKEKNKIYYSHSGYIGHLKEEQAGALRMRDSRELVRRAVLGMLPKNRLRKERIKKLSLHKGEAKK